ncbi:putative non-specific serine/threonine protein kinase [Helianthus annuus]|nr:putative non-specific serine/threonine protein kinase [Helianthus annuus]
MRLGWDRKTGVNRFMWLWKSGMDPGSGSYTFKMNVDGFPEIFLSAGVKPVYRSGPWNEKRFSGVPEMKGVNLIKFEFENNYNEVFYSYEMANKSDYSRLIMTSSGTLRRFTWIESSKTWNPYWFAPRDQCNEYRKCGPWGVCDANASPLCKCMKGFRPKNQQVWDLRDGSDGCVRSSEMDCGSDEFRLMKNMKLPEGSKAFVDQTLGLSECGEICKRYCVHCNMYDHFTANCRTGPRQATAPAPAQPALLPAHQGQQAAPAPAIHARACFACGDPNHFANTCPNRVVKQEPQQQAARARTFNINARQAQADNNVVNAP